MTGVRNAALGIVICVLTGCAGVGGLSQSLSDTIAAQRDPGLVRAGLPAYLLLADTLARRSPDDAAAQLSAARLYSLYAGRFVDDAHRRRVLTQQAFERARRGLCLRLEDVCHALDGRARAFRQALQQSVDDADAARTLYHFAGVWAGWLQARADDYTALTALPKLQAAFERVLAITPRIDHGFAQVYMGVLLAQRPARYGGHPDEAQRHFRRAIAISHGRNLMAKALYAQYYARLVGNRPLHDRLVQAVLQADPQAKGLTLSNELAQRQARHLRATADDFFQGNNP